MTPNPMTINGNWIESVRDSFPEHAEDIKTNLINIMENHGLEKVDAHGCAYAAALSASNGGLAFEIEMNSPLFINDAEREATKAAAALMGRNNVWYTFAEMNAIEDKSFTAINSTFGVSKQKFYMYSLAASIVGKCNHSIKFYYEELIAEGMTSVQLQNVAKIASIVNAIGKIAI